MNLIKIKGGILLDLKQYIHEEIEKLYGSEIMTPSVYAKIEAYEDVTREMSLLEEIYTKNDNSKMTCGICGKQLNPLDTMTRTYNGKLISVHIGCDNKIIDGE